MAHPELIRQAAEAYLEAARLPPTAAQTAMVASEKVAEAANGYLAQIGPHDRELLGAMRRGLLLMARGVTCRVDDWSARDYVLGRRIVGCVLSVYLDVRREAEEREAAERLRAEAAQARPVAATLGPDPRAPPPRPRGRPPIHRRDD